MRQAALNAILVQGNDSIASVFGSAGVHDPERTFLKAFGVMGVSKQKNICLLLSGSVDDADIAGLHAVLMPVGHHNRYMLQREEFCKRTFCAVVTVSRYVLHGNLRKAGLQCKKILHTVAKMEHIIRLME